METSTGDSMKERKKEAKRQISSEGEDGKIKNKNGKKNSKKKGAATTHYNNYSRTSLCCWHTD